MEKIALTQETIDAIIGYKETLCERFYSTFQEDCTATFYQGDNIIDVDYYLYMKWIRDMEPHTELQPNIPEDLSHWECYNVDITDVNAFDNDGNDLIITNKQELYDKEN